MNKEYKFYKYENNEKGSDYCFIKISRKNRR